MASYVLKRVSVSVVLLILSSILIFCLMRVIPGDPTITKVAAAGTGGGANVRALRAVRHELGLDRSLPRQYVRTQRIIHGLAVPDSLLTAGRRRRD